jgi:hypothetical protein
MEEAPLNEIQDFWSFKLEKAVDHDSWGQIIEALDEYKELASLIGLQHSDTRITSPQKELMHRVVLCISRRVEIVSAVAPLQLQKEISSLDIRKLVPFMKRVFSSGQDELEAFPLEPIQYRDAAPIRPALQGHIKNVDERADTEFEAKHAARARVAGTLVGIKIDKWGLKDAQTYIEPITSVLVALKDGTVIDAQDTPVATEKRVAHVVFGSVIYLRVSLEEMKRRGAAIFFEFKHYKPKKKKVSTRCWCFMEMSEVKADEETVLEIYHKPTDLFKKKLKLHSVKDLYFHCSLSLTER